MRNVKFISLLLMTSLLTAACGTTASPSDTADTTSESPETTAETTNDFTSYLAQEDFGGATYNILGRADGDLASLYAYELTTDTENGDIINDTVYQRNAKICDYFNINITSELLGREEMAEAVKTSVMAGDNRYDLLWGSIVVMPSLATGGYLRNLYDLDELSLDMPWWNQTVVESLTIDGKLPLAFCDIPFTSMLFTHCMFVNTRLADEYLDENIYDIVNDGRWTMDKCLTVTADLNNDVNGDTIYDENDFYGFMSSYGAIGIFSTSGGQHVLNIGPDNSVTLTVMTDAMQSIVDKTYKLAYDNNSSYIVDNSLEGEIARMFADGQSLFYSGFLSDPLLYFRDMPDNFMLIPFPKYDEAQDGYYTSISGGNGMLAMPQTLRDEHFTATITEALAIESYQNLRPAVYETVMVGKLLRDEESYSMFETIIDGIKIDFGWLYTDKGFGRTLRDLMQKRTTDLSSYYSSREAMAEQYYKDVINAYTGEN